jgi:glutamyl-tRNA reductase
VKAYRRTADDAAVDEAVIVSTCNRVEIYGNGPVVSRGVPGAEARALRVARGRARRPGRTALLALRGPTPPSTSSPSRAGWIRWCLGEPQILSQVTGGAQARRGRAGPRAHRSRRCSTRRSTPGAACRSETGVGAAPDVFVAAGADLGAEALGGPRGPHAVVIGAGQMSALAVKHLRQRGVETVRVLNRSSNAPRGPWPNERRPNPATGGAARRARRGPTGRDLGHRRRRCGPHRGLVREGGGRQAAAVVRARPRRPQDVEPAAGRLRGITLVDIDGLRAVGRRPGRRDRGRHRARAHDRRRRGARFSIRRRAERLGPLFRALRERGDAAVDAELERFRSEARGARAAGSARRSRPSRAGSSPSSSTNRSCG